MNYGKYKWIWQQPFDPKTGKFHIDKLVENMKRENYTPQVGDIIRITKSDEAWNEDMNKHVGRVVRVDAVTKIETGKWAGNVRVYFDGGGSWPLHYHRRHFEVLKSIDELKVGDKVQITKSELNWDDPNSIMDKFVGDIVTITSMSKVNKHGFDGWVVKFDKIAMNRFQWVSNDLHFKMIVEETEVDEWAEPKEDEWGPGWD